MNSETARGCRSSCKQAAAADQQRLQHPAVLTQLLHAVIAPSTVDRIMAPGPANEQQPTATASPWPRESLENLFSASCTGLAVLDESLRVVRANDQLAQMLGVPPAVLPGARLQDAVDSFPSAVLRQWRHVVRTGAPRRCVELDGITGADAVTRHWSGCWYPVQQGDETVGLGLVVIDVTRQKQAQSYMHQVLGVVGHDLRGPLGAVRSCVEALLRTSPLSDLQRTMLERIEASLVRMRRIAELLVDFTRASIDETFPIEPRPCRLEEACKPVLDELHTVYPSRLIVHRQKGDLRGRWDGERLGQAVGNLLSNALQYSPQDSPVEVTTVGGRAEVVMQIRNSGPLIPADAMSRLFEPFQRLGQGRRERSKGLGLGLYIAREIVRAHGGTIKGSSSPQEGTIFTVKLPRRPPRRTRR